MFHYRFLYFRYQTYTREILIEEFIACISENSTDVLNDEKAKPAEQASPKCIVVPIVLKMAEIDHEVYCTRRPVHLFSLLKIL